MKAKGGPANSMSLADFKKKCPIKESDVQRATVDMLSMLGYLVLETSIRARMVRCPACSNVFHPASSPASARGGVFGTTPGVPDLLVRPKKAPSGVWIGIELKGPKTAISPEQQVLAGGGHTFIARSADEAVEIMRRCDSEFAKIPPDPPI